MRRDDFTMSLDLGHELIIDNFAGGGGTSTGLEEAFGRPVDIAINHDPEALALHAMNHPHTRHLCESVWDVDPIKVTGNQPVGLVWLSPDCKHFSKAKGGTPVAKNIRGLAWVTLRWAAKCKPRVIMLENVEEFKTWGPLLADAEGNFRPDPAKKGKTFESFLRQLRGLGYTVDHKELTAFLNEHANASNQRVMAVDEPLRTICAQVKGGHISVVSAHITKFRTGATGSDLSEPLPTITAGPKERPAGAAHALGLVTAHIQRDMGQSIGHGADAPLGTVTAGGGGKSALVASSLVKLRGTSSTASIDEPLHTISAGGQHHAEVRAFLLSYYGSENETDNPNSPLRTVTSRERFGLVTIQGIDYQIVDIGLRMLDPAELYRAQGFPESYIIREIPNPDLLFKDGRQADGNPLDLPRIPLTKSAQVRMCGNSVCPPMARALIQANFTHELECAWRAA